MPQYPDLPCRPVSDVMAKGVVAVDAGTNLRDVAAKFKEAKVHRVLVTDAGRLAGVIALADLAGHLTREDVGQVVAEVSGRAVPPSGAAMDARGLTAAGGTRRGAGPWAWASPAAFWGLLRETARSWSEDKVPRLGAALAFYSTLSIAPLVLIAIAVAALAFGQEAARGQLVGQIRGMVGKEGAEAVQEMLKNAAKPGRGVLASVLGVATLLLAASGVFGQLQDAMNTIWEVRPKPGRGVVGALHERFLSFAMVLGTGFLLLISLVLSAGVAAAFAFAGRFVPGLGPLLQVGDTLASAVVVALLFAMIFKLLPDARVAWRDVWVGAAITTALFLVGRAGIGVYLGRSGYGTAYGAAGSLVVLLVWVYYSSQILFFGAEFTKAYANRYGSRIEPSAGAERVTADARAHEGIPKDDRRS